MPKYNVRRKAQLGLDIREGGIAIPIANNMFYIDGRKHAAGGVAIGPNNKNGVEVEGGEVVEMIDSNHPSVGRQFKAGGQQQTMRVFSSVPLLRGVSPAQLVLGGANPDTVFKAQEAFKDRNRINDDGTTYEVGGEKIYTPSKSIQRQIQETGKITIGGAPTIGGLRTAKYVKGLATAKGYVKQANKIFTKVNNFVNNSLQRLINKHKITPNQADAYKKFYNEIVGVNGVNIPKTASFFLNNESKEMKAGGIYIKPSKRGTFTAAATKHGMGVQEFAGKVLANKEDYSPAMVKKANFARNASRWKKEYGGDENVLPEVVVTGKKPKTFFEKLDDYADIGEKVLAVPNLALSGASLISPNPITIGGAYLTSASGALLDLYQGGRALYKGDWFNAGKNAIDLGLSLIGLRALRNGNKLNELDKALDASGATRKYVRKSVGRGRGKRKATFTKEKNEAITQEAIGYCSIPASTAFSMIDTDKNRKEYGGSMIYTINGNVKNGLMSVRPKAEWGKGKDDKKWKYVSDPKNFVRGYCINTPYGKLYSDGTSYLDANGEITWNRFPKFMDEAIKYQVNKRPQYYAEKRLPIAGSQSIAEKAGLARSGWSYADSPTLDYVPNINISVPINYAKAVGDNSKKSTSSTPRGERTKSTTSSKYVAVEHPSVVRRDEYYSTPEVKNDSTQIDESYAARQSRGIQAVNEQSTSSTGGGTQSKDGRWIGQYKTTNVGDWIGLGSNLAGSVASYFITKNAINKMPEPIKPVMAQAAKLKTRYNVEPQLSEIREAEQTNRATVRRNTQSSNTSLAREQRLMNEARGARNTLYGQKENIETQLINQDRLNRQSVMRDNVRAYNEYLNRVTATKMAQNEMRVSNINNLISGLTGSVNSILGNIESRRATNNTLRAIAAANPNVDARLIGGFDYYIDPITKKKYNKNQQYVGTINV